MRRQFLFVLEGPPLALDAVAGALAQVFAAAGVSRARCAATPAQVAAYAMRTQMADDAAAYDLRAVLTADDGQQDVWDCWAGRPHAEAMADLARRCEAAGIPPGPGQDCPPSPLPPRDRPQAHGRSAPAAPLFPGKTLPATTRQGAYAPSSVGPASAGPAKSLAACQSPSLGVQADNSMPAAGAEGGAA